MKIIIDIADSAYNYFKEQAEDMGCPVEALINSKVKAVHHRAELAKWREEDAEDDDDEAAEAEFLENSFGEDDDEW